MVYGRYTTRKGDKGRGRNRQAVSGLKLIITEKKIFT
jgi:hypothetical protein